MLYCLTNVLKFETYDLEIMHVTLKIAVNVNITFCAVTTPFLERASSDFGMM